MTNGEKAKEERSQDEPGKGKAKTHGVKRCNRKEQSSKGMAKQRNVTKCNGRAENWYVSTGNGKAGREAEQLSKGRAAN